MNFDESQPTSKWIWGMVIWSMGFSFFLLYCLISFWPDLPPLKVSLIEPPEGRAGETIKISGSGFANNMTVSFQDDNGSSVVGSIEKTESNALMVKLPKHDKGVTTLVVRDATDAAVAIPHGFTFKAPASETSAASTAQTTAASVSPAGGNPPAGQSKASSQAAAPAHVAPPQKTASPAAAGPPSNSTPPAGAGASTEPSGTGGANAAAPQIEHRNLEGSNETNAKFFGSEHWLRYPVRMLIIVMIVGALGSLMHVVRSFFWYVGNGQLKNRWLLMYLLLPFNGSGLAALFYLIIRGGISSSAPTNPSSLDGYAAIAALVGLFSQQAMEKLKQIAEAFFSSVSPGENSVPTSPATTQVSPKIVPPVGTAGGGTPFTISGTGFAQGDAIKFDNVDATGVNVASSTQITATTPAHAPGVVDVEVSNAGVKKVSLPKSFTYQ